MFDHFGRTIVHFACAFGKTNLIKYLSEQGFQKCQLGIDKDNPQSNHFWRKNGFEVIREVEIEEGIILVAEKQL